MVLSKTDKPSPEIDARLAALGLPRPVILPPDAISLLTLSRAAPAKGDGSDGHVPYVSWQHRSDALYIRSDVEAALLRRPAGLYRLKGFLRTPEGDLELHVVG